MYALKFNEKICETCSTSDCLVKCQYIKADRETAHEEMLKIIKGEESFVLHDCAACYSCEEYCPYGNHPFFMISEKREEKGILLAPRPVTDLSTIHIDKVIGGQAGGEYGDIKEEAVTFCFSKEMSMLAQGSLFDDIRSSYVVGLDFGCHVGYLHFAKPSMVKERLPRTIEKIGRLGIKKLICVHDECYGSYTAFAQAYGMEVPFEPVHYLEYMYGKLLKRKSEITPLNIRAAYQRPCSARLSPDKHHAVKDIFDVIGVELVDRRYQGEKALCCGSMLRVGDMLEVSRDVQKRNIEDMVKSKAEYCVFNCPICLQFMAEGVMKSGIKPIHITDLCRIALGEKIDNGGQTK